MLRNRKEFPLELCGFTDKEMTRQEIYMPTL